MRSEKACHVYEGLTSDIKRILIVDEWHVQGSVIK